MDHSQYVALKCQEALEVLRKVGWHRESYVKSADRYRRQLDTPQCLMGALKTVTTGFPWKSGDGTTKVMLEVAKAIPGDRLIDDWNDDPYTTFEDVEMVLKTTISRMES